MDMHHEPIRLPATAVAVLLVAGPVVIAWLLGADVREAAAAALAGLIASGGVIGVAESRRARTDSPATIQKATEDAWASFEAIRSDAPSLPPTETDLPAPPDGIV